MSNLARGLLFIDGLTKDMTSGVTFSFKDSFLGMGEQYEAVLTDQNVSCMYVSLLTPMTTATLSDTLVKQTLTEIY